MQCAMATNAWTHTLWLRGHEQVGTQVGVITPHPSDVLHHFIRETHHMSHKLVMGEDGAPIE